MGYRTEIPEDVRAWPFRSAGDYLEQFNQKFGVWMRPKGSKDASGYVMLSYQSPEGRRFVRAHIAAWKCHHGEIPEGFEIDHIDGDKSNNDISNLRLCTHAENMRHAYDRLGNWGPRKLQPHQVELLLAMVEVPRGTLRVLADRWGVSKFSLGNIRALAKKNGDPRLGAGLERTNAEV